jgi:beta-carotene 15,15'-dioxygenase
MGVPVSGFAKAVAYMTRSIGAATPPSLRLWALPLITVTLLFIESVVGIGSPKLTLFATLAIVVSGIPHGTLDVEIAAKRFSLSGLPNKFAIILAYLGCALLMIILWDMIPEAALSVFLFISIVHFSADWHGSVDPFLAMMVGWAIIAFPALSHPASVAEIFKILTGNQNGKIIADLLACASVPAVLGSLVFSYWSVQKGDAKIAIDVACCLIAALLLPPLIAFAVFFCGLHSPRHMRDALKETDGISPLKKTMIVAAVTGLSFGMGVIIFTGNNMTTPDAAVIRAGIILLSTLTVPHFILEHLLRSSNQNA